MHCTALHRIWHLVSGTLHEAPCTQHQEQHCTILYHTQCRLIHGKAWRLIATLFQSTRKLVQDAKRRMQLFLLMRDPLNSLPTILNAGITPAQVSLVTTCLPAPYHYQIHTLLTTNAAGQSALPQHIVSAIRTPSGLPVMRLTH